MKAPIPTLAPALTAVLAIAVLWTVPARGATPGADGPALGETPSVGDKPPATQTVSSDDVRLLATEYFNEGAEAQAAGRLEPARAKFRAALSLDPKHLRAKAALAAVEKALGITEADRTREKLDNRIPEVSFTQAPLREVVDYLAHEADVNIIFHAAALETLSLGQPPTSGQDSAPPEDLEPTAEQPQTEVPGFIEAVPEAQPRTDLITIHLKDVPLREVLRYVLRYKGLKYVVEEYAVLIVPIGWVPPDDMETEVFRLATGAMGARRSGPDGANQAGY